MKQLDRELYPELIEQVRGVPFNNLFARAVFEKSITGKIYVDNVQYIKTAYIYHPYGMSLLLGENTNILFNRHFKEYALNNEKERKHIEWMQTYPRTWDNTLSELFGCKLISSADCTSDHESGLVELNTRVNFKFNKTAYLSRRTENTNPDIRIAETDRQMYREMKGTVIPKFFWDNEDDFFKNGKAYCLLYKGKLASMAFASFKFENKFELGIETGPEYRGKGLAELVCSMLIGWCLEKNYEPVWACRKENTSSYRLALKLGFHPVLELPYYRLSI